LQEFLADGQTLDDWAARKAGLGGMRDFYRIKKVAKTASDDVYAAVKDHKITIYRALQVCTAEKSIQPSLLTRILKKEAEEPKTPEERKNARNKKQEEKAANLATGYVIPKAPEDKFNVIRVAPDWANTNIDAIRALPVRGFSSPIAIVCLECPTRYLDLAFEALNFWGMHYKAMITLGWKKYVGVDMPYVSQNALHVVIGQVDPDEDLPHDELERMPTVQSVNDPYGAAEYILTDYLDKFSPDCGCKRIDFSATEPHDGWKSLETFRKR